MSDQELSADDATLYRMLAAASGEDQPEPLNISVGYRTRTVYLHVALADDLTRWQQWWTAHGADEDWAPNGGGAPEGRQRYAVCGDWQGWRIELVYLVPAQPEGGAS